LGVPGIYVTNHLHFNYEFFSFKTD
jgi:hypothetical protein